MEQVTLYSIIALAGLMGTALISTTALRGWRDWLALKRLQLDKSGDTYGDPSPTSRIEIADLKERLRKLEAIAAGVEL